MLRSQLRPIGRDSLNPVDTLCDCHRTTWKSLFDFQSQQGESMSQKMKMTFEVGGVQITMEQPDAKAGEGGEHGMEAQPAAIDLGKWFRLASCIAQCALGQTGVARRPAVNVGGEEQHQEQPRQQPRHDLGDAGQEFSQEDDDEQPGEQPAHVEPKPAARPQQPPGRAARPSNVNPRGKGNVQ